MKDAIATDDISPVARGSDSDAAVVLPRAPETSSPVADDDRPTRGDAGGGREDDGDPGDGGGGGWEGHESGPPIEGAKIAMWVLICSLSMFFIGLTSSYVVLRSGAATWPPPGIPALPGTLWLNTIVIFLSSAFMFASTAAARRGDLPALRRNLMLTSLGGAAFVALQALVWRSLVGDGLQMAGGIYGGIFYTLTGLHALHVVGGVVGLGYVLARSLGDRYEAGEAVGVEVCGMYWHFVGLVWIVLFLVLYVFE